MINLNILTLCLCFVLSLFAIAKGNLQTTEHSFQNIVTAENLNAVNNIRSYPNPFRSVKIFLKKIFGTRRQIVGYRYTPPLIDTITLNRKILIINCQSQDLPQNSCSEDKQAVEITVHATDKDGDPFIYSYEVSAGKIVGTGSKVIWDLSGAAPGTYEVKVYADDGCGLCGKPAVMEIRVIECDKCN